MLSKPLNVNSHSDQLENRAILEWLSNAKSVRSKRSENLETSLISLKTPFSNFIPLYLSSKPSTFCLCKSICSTSWLFVEAFEKFASFSRIHYCLFSSFSFCFILLYFMYFFIRFVFLFMLFMYFLFFFMYLFIYLLNYCYKIKKNHISVYVVYLLSYMCMYCVFVVYIYLLFTCFVIIDRYYMINVL